MPVAFLWQGNLTKSLWFLEVSYYYTTVHLILSYFPYYCIVLYIFVTICNKSILVTLVREGQVMRE